jgi:hypothetical protein
VCRRSTRHDPTGIKPSFASEPANLYDDFRQRRSSILLARCLLQRITLTPLIEHRYSTARRILRQGPRNDRLGRHGGFRCGAGDHLPRKSFARGIYRCYRKQLSRHAFFRHSILAKQQELNELSSAALPLPRRRSLLLNFRVHWWQVFRDERHWDRRQGFRHFTCVVAAADERAAGDLLEAELFRGAAE